MSFFVTSSGLGNGADLGGLAGADQHCQTLATAAGAGSRTWRAYLSTMAVNGVLTGHARERVGKGPWFNARGQMIASDVEHLHGENNLIKQTALNEKGDIIPGRGDTPKSDHDTLTGSKPDGRALSEEMDSTSAVGPAAWAALRWSATMTAREWTEGAGRGTLRIGLKAVAAR